MVSYLVLHLIGLTHLQYWELTESLTPAVGFKSASLGSYGNTGRTTDFVLSGTAVTAGAESDTCSNPCGLTVCNNVYGICMPVRGETGCLPAVHHNEHSGDDSNASAVRKGSETGLDVRGDISGNNDATAPAGRY